ncbi:MAG: ABC transporter ATP-binding protein [Nocardioides sp.]
MRFGEVEAVAGVDLQGYAGQATALLGRNGAGKSTTMRVLAGVVPPTAGEAWVAGLDVRTQTLAVKRMVGYCPDVGGLVPRATPWEHLQLAARLRRMNDWEPRGRDLLERFELGDAAHRITAGFSHGMGRRLSVVLAAMHEPDVLRLDEPFDGVDPDRCRGDLRRDRRRPCPRSLRAGLDAPAGARDRGLRHGAGDARRRPRGDRRRGRHGRGGRRSCLSRASGLRSPGRCATWATCCGSAPPRAGAGARPAGGCSSWPP